MRRILFTNANIIPMTGPGQRFSSMGICGDTIDYLGNDVPPGYGEVVDLGGKYIFPGLCDSHVHLLYSIVLAASSFNICSITEDGVKPCNIRGIEEKLRDYAKNHPKQKLIAVNGYITPAIGEHRLPFASELDEWCCGKKVAVFSIDGHSCALSSSFMDSIGIKSSDGIFTGSSYDMQQGKITGLIASAVTPGTLIRGIANFENQCLKYGISKVCALDGEEAEGGSMLLSLLAFLARRMDIKVRLFPQYMSYEKTASLQKKMGHRRIGGCSKWELDGSVGSYSAAFYNPYKNGETGKTYYDQEYIDGKVRQALEQGYTLTCHAIGPGAIDLLTEAYRKSEDLIPGEGPLCRIDHFEFPSEAAIEFVKGHRLAVTLQPGYSYIDKRYIRSYENHLQPEDVELLCPLRELAESGVVLLGSSDSPVQDVNPYAQMLGMMDYYIPEQSIDAYEALKTYTLNSGIALGEKEGFLAEGSRADFFICPVDITALDASAISSIGAEAVYINGRRLERKAGGLKDALSLLFRRPAEI